ncbi:MAG: transposase [Burkholderiales bacterium]|nr:transposase [Burkholderiales bacterium]
MPINAVQFQRGLSMSEFFDRYGSQEKCEAALMVSRWPRGFACPSCSGAEHTTFRRGQLLYLQCSACRHQASLIVVQRNEASVFLPPPVRGAHAR